MTAYNSSSNRVTFIIVAVCFFLAGMFCGGLLFGASTVHICGNDLCNGATIISIPQPTGKKVLAFEVSADGSRVLYVSNASCKRDLYSVAASGGPSVMVSDLPTTGQDPCFRNVTDEFSFSPDGLFAVWEADRDKDQDYELFSTPVLGGLTVQLNPPLQFDNDVEHHLISCDSQFVVYRQGKDSSDTWQLWSARIRPAVFPTPPYIPRRISQAVTGLGKDVGWFRVTCDGIAHYGIDLSTAGVYEEWKVGVTGVPEASAVVAPEMIFLDGFESGSTWRWL